MFETNMVDSCLEGSQRSQANELQTKSLRRSEIAAFIEEPLVELEVVINVVSVCI